MVAVIIMVVIITAEDITADFIPAGVTTDPMHLGMDTLMATTVTHTTDQMQDLAFLLASNNNRNLALHTSTIIWQITLQKTQHFAARGPKNH
jgi:hypothetical protein